MTCWFENEMRFHDKNRKIVQLFDWKPLSKQIIDKIYSYNDNIKKLIIDWDKKIDYELDCTQIEIRNVWWHDTLESAQEDLVNSFWIVKRFAKEEFGLDVSNHVGTVKDHNYKAIHSWAKPKYETIHNNLLGISQKTRNSTDVVGLHFSISDNENFKRLIVISKAYNQLLNTLQFDEMMMDKDRFESYVRVVEWLQKLWYTKHSYIPKILVDTNDVLLKCFNWNEADFSYEFIRLKWNLDKKLFLVENRTVDAWVNEDDLLKKTRFIYKKTLDILS